ncbi:MAG: cell wall-binding repeat-containing protein [Desulfitobacteriia bacterium]
MKRFKAKAILAIMAMVLMLFPVQIFAAASDSNADSLRLAGIDRIETALAISHAGWDYADKVILAPSNQSNLVDALAAAPLAGQENAPILLTPVDRLDSRVKARLASLGARTVYIIGAIQQRVVDEVEAMSNIDAVVLKGSGRCETAAKINELVTNPNGAFVVGYNALADALSVASYAAHNRYIIIVADSGGNLPAGQQLVGSKIYKIGGPSLVSDNISGERIYGSDRFETNLRVAETLAFDYNRVYVANGFTNHLCDSLAVAPLAAQYNSFVALADNINNQVKAAEYVNTKISAQSRIIAVGGVAVLSDILKAKVGIDRLVVEMAEALNLKQIQVKFNREVNKVSAESPGLYKLDDSSLDNTNLEIDLQKDNRTVLITLGDNDVLTNAQNYKFKVESILSSDGKAYSEAMETTIKYVDTTIPYITDVQVLESKLLRVIFNEPVAKMDKGVTNPTLAMDPFTFEIAGGIHPVVKATADLNKSAVELEISAPLQQGRHEVTVKPSGDNIRDFAGYAPVKHSKIFTVSRDTTAPTVSVKAADETEVRLLFSEPVKNVDSSNVRFRHTYNEHLSGGYNEVFGNAAATAVADTDDKEWLISFGKSKVMPVGNIAFYIGYASSTGDKIEDKFGNILPETTLTLNVVQDKQPPKVLSVVYIDSTHIDVSFDETVIGADIPTNYTLKDNTGSTVPISAAQRQGSTNVYRLTTQTMKGGTYSLTIANIRDNSLTENIMTSTTINFNTSDKVAPYVERASVHDGAKKIRVYFSEIMADDGLVVKENYSLSINGGAPTVLPPGTIVRKIDNRTIEIELKNPVAGLDNSGDFLVVSGSLKDRAGNRISSSLYVQYPINDDSAPDLLQYVADSGKAIAPNKVEFKVNMPLAGANKSKIILGTNLSAGGNNPKDVAIVNDLLANRATVTLTLNADAVDTSFPVATSTVTLQNDAFTSLLGQPVKFSTGLVINDFKDYARPSDLTDNSAKTVDKDNDGSIDGIEITYSENLNTPSVTKEDYRVDGYTVTDVQVSGKIVLVRLQESGALDGNQTVKITQIGEVSDDSQQHNVLGSQATITARDGAAPVLVSWKMDLNPNGAAKKIELTFSEPVLAANVYPVMIKVDKAATGAPQDLAGAYPMQTSDRVVTLERLGPSVVAGINNAAPIRTSTAGDYTLVLEAGAFKDGVNSSAAVTSFGPPSVFTPDTTKLAISSITQVTGEAAKIKVTLDDYILAADAINEGKWTTAGFSLTDANTLDTDLLSIIMTANEAIANGDSIEINGLTDIAGNTAEATKDKGTATGDGAAAIWTID